MRTLTLTLALAALALIGCTPELPTPAQVVEQTIPGCRVTICDEQCLQCATYEPAEDPVACEAVLCGEVTLQYGPPGTDPVIIISKQENPS